MANLQKTMLKFLHILSTLQFLFPCSHCTLGNLNFGAKRMGIEGNKCGENKARLFSVPRNGHLEDMRSLFNVFDWQY